MVQLITWGSLVGPIILLSVFIPHRLRGAPGTAFLRCLLTYDLIHPGMLEMVTPAGTYLAFGTTIIGAILQQGVSLQPDSADFTTMLLLFTTVAAVGLLFYFTAQKRLFLYFVGDLLIYWASIGSCLTLMFMVTRMTAWPGLHLILIEALLTASVVLICWREVLQTATCLCTLCLPAGEGVGSEGMEESSHRTFN